MFPEKRALTPKTHKSARYSSKYHGTAGPSSPSTGSTAREPINTMAQASTAAHCLPLHSRGFHIPPIRQVVRQTPTILSRKPTRKPHHHGKPPFRVGYPPDHAGNRENCFIAAIGGERKFPFRSSPQGMNPFPQSPYTLRHRTLRGGTIHPSPIPPYQPAPVSA